MRSKDWGKLVARLVSLVLVFDAIDGWIVVVGLLQGHSDVWTRPLYLGPPIANTLLALLLYVFASKFAPGDLADDSPEDGPRFVAATVVAAFSAYLLLMYSYSLVAAITNPPQPFDTTRPLNITFNAIVCALCIALAIRSRQVAEWVAR
jgi:hypothetical protein